MNVLVTGGAGFIGSHLAKGLIEDGYHVVIIDDLSGGNTENIPLGAEFVEGSILDELLLEKTFKRFKFEYVYHLAAYAAEGLSHFIKRFNYNNNLIGSVNLINLSILHRVKCFVFTSSIAVYGEITPPMSEKDIPHPEDPYGIAKLAVEQDLRVSSKQFGLNYVVFRPHNVYGEHQNLADRYRNVIGIFMNQLMKGEKLSVFGDGLQTRAFSYISDLIPPMVQCVKRPDLYGQTFNIGADRPTTVLELAEEVMKAFDAEAELLHLPPRNEALHAHADHSLIRKAFAESSQTPLDVGLKKMALWAKNVGPGEASRFGEIEIEEGLPEYWKRP